MTISNGSGVLNSKSGSELTDELYLKQIKELRPDFAACLRRVIIFGMPTYDFVCLHCQQRFDVFLSYSEYGSKTVVCAHCGSENVRRRMTKVRIAKSGESRMEDMMDPAALEGMEDDPRTLGQMMKKMGREMGEDLPPEFDEVTDRLEAGQSPEEIESSLPDLGGSMSAGDED